MGEREAKFTTGDFNQVVLQNVTKAQIKIRTKKDNVAGNEIHNLTNIQYLFYLFNELFLKYVHLIVVCARFFIAQGNVFTSEIILNLCLFNPYLLGIIDLFEGYSRKLLVSKESNHF
ncbi:hypothetical protein NQ314_010165 [Rhamnusium bicolor]|uniref:Uncharacterized protein n=1 Tax=Rhamnusium bicolor TaxID=1586634 RepID=A0AAV8XUJ0_9CUCU|nr:hypothetical protein NQ314_010165 [Rhamnusium bicolor]